MRSGTPFYLPSIVPAVAASILWLWILIRTPACSPPFLASAILDRTARGPEQNKPAQHLMGLWGAGGGMIIWLAGLKGIH